MANAIIMGNNPIFSSFADMEKKIIIDVNASGPVYSNNQSPVSAGLLLSEINAEEVQMLYPVIVFYALILSIGIIGNVLVLLVYSFRYKRSPARVYILFLATIDFTICLFGLPYHLIDLTHPYTFTNSAACKSLTFIVTTLFHMSIFGLIVIAVDRYLKICHPLGKLQLSYFGRRRACAAAVIAAFALSWPQLILYGPSEMESPLYNVTGYACFIETSYFETNYPFIYIMSTLVVCVGSTIFLIVTYSLICREIYIRYKNSKFPLQNSAAALDDVSVTEEVSLKSYSLPVVEKLRTKTTVLSSSADSLAKEMPRYSHVPSNEGSSSRINIYLNPDEDGCDEVKVNKETKAKDDDKTEQMDHKFYQLIPQKDKDIDEPINKLSCISRQRSFSLDGYEFNRVHSTDDANITFDGREPSYGKRSSDKGPIKDQNKHAESDIDKAKRISDSSTSYSKSSNTSSTKELCLNEDSIRDPEKNLKIRRTNNKLELPCKHLLAKQTSLERRYSEQLGNRNAIKRHQRSFSMGIGHTNGLTRVDGLRIHTFTNSMHSIGISSQGTVKSAKAVPKQHSKITKIMLTITSVFILSYAPALIITIYSFVYPELWDVLSIQETVVCEFFLRFYLVNNICNPFIYGFWDKRFKREIIITLTKIFRFRGKCEKCYERVPLETLWRTKA